MDGPVRPLRVTASSNRLAEVSNYSLARTCVSEGFGRILTRK